MAYQVTIYTPAERAAQRAELQKRAARACFRYVPSEKGWFYVQEERIEANFGRPEGNLVTNSEWLTTLENKLAKLDLPVADKLRLLEDDKVCVLMGKTLNCCRCLKEYEKKALIKRLGGLRGTCESSTTTEVQGVSCASRKNR